MAVFVGGFALGALIALGTVGWLARDPTVVYLIYGYEWRRPLRVGVTDAGEWGGYRHCPKVGECRRHRMCKYLSGQDRGSRSHVWAGEVEWRASPLRWPALLRRRHRVVFVVVPWRPVALWLERRLIRRYQPPWNVAHVERHNRGWAA